MRNPQHIDRKPDPHPLAYIALFKPPSGAQIGRGGTMVGAQGRHRGTPNRIQIQTHLQAGKLSDKQETFKDFKKLLSLQNKMGLLLKSKLKDSYSVVQRPKCLIKKSLESKSKSCFKKLFLLSEIFFLHAKSKFFSEKVSKATPIFLIGFHAQTGKETGSARWICSRVN
jgi:hypothetical protein